MKLKAILLVTILIISGLAPVLPSSLCYQTFELVGKTEGNNGILFMYEHISGECSYTYLISIYLTPKRGVGTEFKSGWEGDTSFSDSALSNFSFEDYLTGEPTGDGKFRFNDSIIISPPKTDPTFEKRYHRLIEDAGMGDPKDWKKHNPYDYLDLPEVAGTSVQLLYYNKRGLYKNYSIKAVYLFPASGYLVVVTDQPKKAVGMDTMHGMLVYKILD